jgi:glycosyltransferase involved in cell wall biosynthesis
MTGLGGGIELYLRQFLDAAAEANPDLRYIAVLGREPRLARPHLLSQKLRARLTVSGASDEGRLRRIGSFMARVTLAAAMHRPRLIVCGHVNYSTLCYLLARATGARVLTLTYGYEAWDIAGSIGARALRASDRVVAISRFTADELTRSANVDESRIEIVNNCVDVTRFTPGTARQSVEAKLADLPKPRLLTVCRLDAKERYKGVDTVLRTLARNPSLAASYLIVGDGTDRGRLEALARELRVCARFYGRAADDELLDLYRACDLFVMPSRKEGFGYVFIEAMAAGLPVVAGNMDGSVDALAGGALGVLVDPTNEAELADAIRLQLTGRTPPIMRDPEALHREVGRLFGARPFGERVAAVLSRSLAGT